MVVSLYNIEYNKLKEKAKIQKAYQSIIRPRNFSQSRPEELIESSSSIVRAYTIRFEAAAASPKSVKAHYA